MGDDAERLWSRIEKRGPDECWPWKGSRDESGYGLFYFRDETGRRRRTRAHRWLLGHLRGRPLILKPTGVEDGCHRCDNPPCCNPAHLYVGTRKQNIGEAVERSRLWQFKVTHCPRCGTEYSYNPSGKHRRCKTCERAGQRKARTDDRKKCRNGHDLIGDNILLCKNGTRKCRICDAARMAGRLRTESNQFAPSP